MHKLLMSLFLLVLCGCTACPQNYLLLGPEEFVSDSLKIQEGKAAIKELKGECLPPLPGDALQEQRDFITEGDVLNVVVYHPKRRDLMEAVQFINAIQRGFVVTEGTLTLPCIPDPVFVAGMTIGQARLAVKKKICEELKDADVFLSYIERRSNRVELTGLVGKPFIPVDGRIRLFEVLAKAQLAPHANLYESYVLRDGEQLNVDFYQLLHEGDMSQNIVMQGGDRIFIAAPVDSTVLVMGEVRNPHPVRIPYGFISVREVLALANGIPFTGNANRISIIRGDITCPTIYTISWKFMLHQPNENLLLIPGDIVYVYEKPITKWNIFLQQLQPTITAAAFAADIYEVAR